MIVDADKLFFEDTHGQVYCGDNCELLCKMPAQSVDLIVTSPPYDDLRTYGGHDWDFYGVAWLCKRVLKAGGVLVWNVADATTNGNESGNSMRQALHFQSLGLRLHDTMIYQKLNGGINGSREAYLACWEYMFVFANGKPKTINLIADRPNVVPPRIAEERQGRRNADGSKKDVRVIERKAHGIRWNVWQYHVGSSVTDDPIALRHPAIFPEQMAKDHIATWSNEGDVVLDPFSGSGTTAKCAKHLGRRYIALEVNAEYCKIIA